MGRSRLILGLTGSGIFAALLLIVALLAFAIVTGPRRWEAGSIPPPDSLVRIGHLVISPITDAWSFEVDDPADLAQFAEFAAQGSCRRMEKSGYGYKVRVTHRDGEAVYYHHGDALGPKPGGFIQIVFIPTAAGFQAWFENLLQRHGHPDPWASEGHSGR